MSDAVSSLKEPVLPAMIVGRTDDDREPPLGLGEPFALMGGDRLGPAGIRFALAHEWQPDFLAAVENACETAIREERCWFRLPPALLVAHAGVGRTHAARRLASAAGVPHVILNLCDPLIAANLGNGGEIGEALWISPLTAAMAATRIANPVVSVIGVGTNPHADAALAEMIDPETASSWHEDKLGVEIDLGEVSWLIQVENTPYLWSSSQLGGSLDRSPFSWLYRTGREQALGASLSAHLTEIRFNSVRDRGDEVQLSVALEVLEDLGLDPADPSLDIAEILKESRHFSKVRDLYAALHTLFVERQYQSAISNLHANEDTTHPPRPGVRVSNRKDH